MRPALGIRVLIVDDHPVVRHGLMEALGRERDMTVVGAAADLGQALDLCRTDPPDVVLLDLRLPGALPVQAVTKIRGAHPAGVEHPHSVQQRHRTGGPPFRPQILILSTDEAGEDLCRALGAGAAGCVLRTAELEEMVAAIRAIHTGEGWLSDEIAEKCRAYQNGTPLCEDELACLRLLAAGKTIPQITALLGRSERDVRERLRQIRSKLGAKNLTHALVTALQRGIVSLE